MGNSLHHYSEKGVYQFVTFRTQDSIDPFLIRLSTNMELSVSVREMKIDAYSDILNKGCYLTGEILTLMMNYITALDAEYYQLYAVSIMPNHVHLLFQQKQDLSLVMQKIKGATAFYINKQLSRKGHFWSKSYFDKAIRDEKHFNIVYEYIKNNAVKANLNDADLRFYGHYENLI